MALDQNSMRIEEAVPGKRRVSTRNERATLRPLDLGSAHGRPVSHKAAVREMSNGRIFLRGGMIRHFVDAIHVELLPSLRTAVFMCVGKYQEVRASFGASAHTGAGENPRQAIDFL